MDMLKPISTLPDSYIPDDIKDMVKSRKIAYNINTSSTESARALEEYARRNTYTYINYDDHKVMLLPLKNDAIKETTSFGIRILDDGEFSYEIDPMTPDYQTLKTVNSLLKQLTTNGASTMIDETRAHIFLMIKSLVDLQPPPTRYRIEFEPNDDREIRDFLSFTRKLQKLGDFVFIGISEISFPDVKHYKLGELLPGKFAESLGYNLHGSAIDNLQGKLYILLKVTNDPELKSGVMEINGGPSYEKPVEKNHSPESLLIEQRKDVVIFGEGNFTFSIALAALRKSWNEMVVTKFEEGLPKFTEGMLQSIEWCISNFRELRPNCAYDVTDNVAILRELVNVQPPLFDMAWKDNIDATDVPEDLEVRNKVVWFQCPWPYWGSPLNPAQLIQSFLEHMKTKQQDGDYVLIGITTHKDFVERYELGALAEKRFMGYTFLGSDRDLIKELLKYGYKHEAVEDIDIHEYILDYHLTLVFQNEGN